MATFKIKVVRGSTFEKYLKQKIQIFDGNKYH